jgi:uncharacterized protein
MSLSAFLKVGLFALSLYVAVSIAAFVFQRHLLFFPSPTYGFSPTDAGLNYEQVWIDTEDGERLHAWFIPTERETGAEGTVLFFQGNAGNKATRIPLARELSTAGYNVLLVDYRGYGQSTGQPSEEGLYADAMASWHFLTDDRRIAPGDIAIFGRSLGGGPATWLATQVDARALLLESTFTSVPDVAAHHYPFLPVRWLSRFQFDSLSRIAGVGMPVHIIHGRTDEVVPFEFGKRLHDAAHEPKTFTATSDTHNRISKETTRARIRVLDNARDDSALGS